MIRPQFHWSASLWFLFLAVPSFAAENDFSFYPQTAQTCLYKASDASSCSGKTVAENNSCLCSNGDDFITNSAKCMGSDNVALAQTYDTMKEACAGTSTPIAITEKQWNEAAAKNSSDDSTSIKSSSDSTATDKPSETTSNSDSTSTSSSEPSSTSGASDDDDSAGLSTGATIGIGVGAGIAGMAVASGIAFWFFRRYRKRTEESSPMLPQHNDHDEHGTPAMSRGPAAFAAGIQGYNGTYTPSNMTDSVIDPKSPGSQHDAFHSPIPPIYEGQQQQHFNTSQSFGPAELPNDTGNVMRFEMEGSAAGSHNAAEMEGSVVGGNSPYMHQR